MNKNYENFFICITLLQVKIVTKIIEKKRIKKETCCCFYYSNKASSQKNHYFRLLSKSCAKIIKFRNIHRFPLYFNLIDKKIKNLKTVNAYVSNIDGIYVQYILSKIKPINIYTFDDGAGHLFKNTNYNVDYDFNIFKKFIYRLFGNKYSARRIRSESIKHYTIFKGYRNFFSSKTDLLELFKLKKNKRKNECNVILGTIFDEYYKNVSDKNKIKKKLTEFLKNLKIKTFYIKHPRGKTIDSMKNIKNIENIKSEKIAEDVIIDELLLKYNKINLYSFPVSTTQINLENFPNIKNHFFITDNLPQRAFDGLKALKKKYVEIYI